MKKLKLFMGLVIWALILSSCSNDNANAKKNADIIIGKWIMIEKTEANVQVQLGCESNSFDEYSEGNTMVSKSVPFGPSINLIFCLAYEDQELWTWENIGNQQYKFSNSTISELLYTIYLDQNNLVIEHPDGITKTIYKEYSE